jgi:membrane protein YdbS with pleckstrin-like domain
MGKNNTNHQILHSFCLNPNIHFDGQDADEYPILVLRAHPVSQLPWLFNSFFLILFVLFLNFFLPKYLNSYQVIFVNFFGLSLIFSYLYFNFMNWFFNVGIITNKRVLDIDFYGLIYKETTIAMLSKVEDITAKVGGFFSSFFDYGNVFVQTAGTEANIEFMNIPKPQEVTKIINQLLENG